MTDAPAFWPACPWCGSHEERSEDDVVRPPPVMNVGICGNCLNVVILGEGDSLRLPSPQEQHRLFSDPQFRAIWVMAHGAKRQALEGRMH